jgi:hypothetical protein
MTDEDSSSNKGYLTRFERNHLLVAVGVLLVISGLWLGYLTGHQQGMSVIGASASDLEKLNLKIDQQQVTLDALNRTLSTAIQERDIALSTSKGLTTIVAKQTADLAVLNDRFKIYRDRLLSLGGMSLALQNVEIVSISPGVFEYNINLMQVRKKSSVSTGAISVRLIQGINAVNIPLTSDRINLTDFQQFKGRWTMPAGFTPEFLEVSAVAGGQSVVQRFAWERGSAKKSTPLVATPAPIVPSAPAQTMPTQAVS